MGDIYIYIPRSHLTLRLYDLNGTSILLLVMRNTDATSRHPPSAPPHSTPHTDRLLEDQITHLLSLAARRG